MVTPTKNPILLSKTMTTLMMRAIVANGQGGPEVMSEKQVPVPVPGEQDMLIEVKASATNTIDVKSRSSNTTPDRILGFDGAGIVRALGAKVDATCFKVGDEVFWAGNLFKAGSLADFEVVDARIVAHKPRTLAPPPPCRSWR